MSESVPVLMNAKAGALHIDSAREQLYKMAKEVGLQIDVQPTHSPDEMRAKLREYVKSGLPKVGIAGGDGTVGIAVQELAHTNTALGILSQGTFNNFASSLRVHHNLPAGLKTLSEGKIVQVDLGKLNGRYFTESAGVGLFADSLALYGAGSNKNFIRGLAAGLRIALAYKAQPMHITIDGQEYDQRVTICEIANTYRVAQAVPIAPYASASDGLLNIVIFADVPARRSLAT